MERIFPSSSKNKSKERAKEERQRADNEATRANTLDNILRNIENSILDDAVKRRVERPEFHREIFYLRGHSGVAYPLELVTTLIKELEEQWSKRRESEAWGEQLRQENKGLASQLYGKDSEAMRNHERRITSTREDRRNDIRELQDQIQEQVEKVSLLEVEKSRLEEGQQALRLEHQEEMRKLKLTHEQIQSDLVAKYNADKMNQKNVYKGEKRDLKSTLQQEHDGEKRRMQWEHDAEVELLGSKIARLKQDLDVERNDLSEIKKEHAVENARLREEQESKRKAFNERLSEIKDQHEDEKNRLREEHELERNALNTTISEMQQNYKSRIERMEQQHQSSIRSLGQKHQSTTDQMEQEHGSIVTKMSREHESRQAQLTARISQMETEHASEQKKMRSDFETRKLQLEHQAAEELARLKADFRAEKAQLEIAHAEETKLLRKDVDAYSTALLQRDDFKPMPDNEIKAKFLDLVQDVDTLARLEWRVDQKAWTSQVLHRLSPNQRLFKKQILQDIIWVILHNYIFCSPFRILGEEGQSLETKWNAECGKDSQLDNGSYTWPKPSVETERWRYVTVKECRAALRQPVPSEWDPRAKLKKGFKTSMDALREEFTSTLGQMANLEKSNVQAMDKIAKKAANMWLEFGMQRCRILVALEGSNLKPAEDKIQRAQEDTLELVIVPELKRFGNSKGQELRTEATVGGCDGETVEVSMRR